MHLLAYTQRVAAFAQLLIPIPISYEQKKRLVAFIQNLYGMKPSHAATLVLVGWYLIVPPSKLSPTYAYQQPLKMWQIIRSFDTADDCEEFKGAFFQSSQQEHALGMLNPSYRDYMFAECIASDDPRLSK